MANVEEPPTAPALGKRKHQSDEEDERDQIELDSLKADLRAMAQTLIRYRTTVPDLLTKVLSSQLAAQRPFHPPPPLAAEPCLTKAEQQQASLPAVDHTTQEKLRIFQEKSDRNLAAMPQSLKRLQECNHKLHQIHQFTVNVHPLLQTKF